MSLKILPVFIPFAGCSQKCIFCNQPSLTGVSSGVSEDSIIRQIEQYLGYSNSWDQLAFYGGSFSCLPEKIRIKLYKIAQSYGFTSLRFSTRPDCINSELIEEFLDNNVVAIELGIQSLNNNILKLSKRSYEDVDALKAIHLLKNSFDTGIQIMPGMFGDTINIFSSTVNRLLITGVDTVRIYPSCIYKDTELEKLYIDGKYSAMTISEAVMFTAFAYVKFYNFGINIIRMGLPMQNGTLIDVVAGPKHEAFGDIVKSYILLLFCHCNSITGTNILLPKQFAGYKKIVFNSFNNFGNNIVSDSDKLWSTIVRTVQEFYFEDNLWYLQGAVTDFAQKIECAANH